MADSVHGKILEAVVTAIEGLTLTGIADADIKQVWIPTKNKRWCPTLPAIHVSPFGSEGIPENEGTNAEDDCIYPVSVAILDNGNQGNTTEIDERLLWRETIIKAFQHAPPTVTGVNVLETTVTPGAIVDGAAWSKNLFASLITLRVRVRKGRT